MRYRFRVSLYDDSDLDKEIADYLANTGRKQEMIRTFIRAGFAMVIKKQEANLAYLSSMDDEQKAIVAQHAVTTMMEEKRTVESPPARSLNHTAYQVQSNEKNDGPSYLKKGMNESKTKENSRIGTTSKNDEVTNSNTQESEDSGEDIDVNDPVDFMTLLQQ